MHTNICLAALRRVINSAVIRDSYLLVRRPLRHPLPVSLERIVRLPCPDFRNRIWGVFATNWLYITAAIGSWAYVTSDFNCFAQSAHNPASLSASSCSAPNLCRVP